MLRFLTAGESHGPQLTAILEGMIAGLPLSEDDLLNDLARRQTGYGRGGRMQIEHDRARITAGVMNGHTTGGPIALVIENRDWRNWREKDIQPFTVPRPGHADLTGAVKYGYRDLRLSLERASARETAARVAVGAVCKRLLAEFGITVGSYVTMIGGVEAELPAHATPEEYRERFEQAEQSEVRCPLPSASDAMRARIREAIQAKDTLGGVFEVVALGVPPGLGSHVHYDRKLDGRLMGAVGSIQAIKGVEIGRAFEDAAKPGTEVHDPIRLADGGRLIREGNNAGGTEGGITTGEAVVVRAAMKPISTTLNPLPTVDLATGQPTEAIYERSDYCAVPRAAVVGEAMVAYVLADALLEKLGGDSLAEIRPRFEALRRSHLDDLPMDNQPWRFGFSE
ncbi:MAG TPA: chorismate synthase [Aggregatilineales bacterium]|nr:chorismate synthase [Aggregatilineales bacterium]